INRTVFMACNLVSRTYFVRLLGNRYLGIDGMLGNVFSVLSLFELGFGEAASQTLYKPLSEHNEPEIKAVISYFSNTYKYIAAVTFALSMAFMPFLARVFPDISNIENYKAIYLLFVFHQTQNFFFAPKRALVICDQRMYAVMTERSISAVFMTFFQIIALKMTGNYLFYVFIRMFFHTADGLIIQKYANIRYPYIKSLKTEIPEKIKTVIKKKTASLAVHRIGGVINASTDSILISARMGLENMGVFSNYSLIINTLGSFVALAVGSASASVGNLGASESMEKNEKVLNKLCFFNFLLLTNCSSLLICLINPVISLWIGNNMTFGMNETAVIIACFFVSYIRDPVQIFISNLGVFSSTKYVYLVRGILNLALSLIFINYYGVVGVFAGTLASTLLTVLPLEPVMLFRYGLKRKPGGFLMKYFSYVLSGPVISALSYALTYNMADNTAYKVAIKGITSLAVTNAAIFLLYHKNEEFRFALDILRKKKPLR
ncbi:MAG: oligosaccharide flippase family protein, partial [Clostridia bacterium]|nr:oligosaccharide flippase family protein [Clostridia bacterium]